MISNIANLKAVKIQIVRIGILKLGELTPE
jgi:hypothetical protein